MAVHVLLLFPRAEISSLISPSHSGPLGSTRPWHELTNDLEQVGYLLRTSVSSSVNGDDNRAIVKIK